MGCGVYFPTFFTKGRKPMRKIVHDEEKIEKKEKTDKMKFTRLRDCDIMNNADISANIRYRMQSS